MLGKPLKYKALCSHESSHTQRHIMPAFHARALKQAFGAHFLLNCHPSWMPTLSLHFKKDLYSVCPLICVDAERGSCQHSAFTCLEYVLHVWRPTKP